jgi:secreted Zn-dependent insulinase-like peptidase
MKVRGAVFNYPNGNLLFKFDEVEGEIGEIIQFTNAGLAQVDKIVETGRQMLSLYQQAKDQGIEFSKLWEGVGSKKEH